MVDAYDGPHTINSQRQLTVPKKVMDAVGFKPGTEVYFQVNAELPGTVLIIPVEAVVRWAAVGRTHEVDPG